MIFHIDPDSGAITLGKILDRETAGWHNITVKAVEAGTLYCFSFQTHRLIFIGAFKQLCLTSSFFTFHLKTTVKKSIRAD